MLRKFDRLLTGNGGLVNVSIKTIRRRKCVYSLIFSCDHVIIVVLKNSKF